MNSSVFAHNYLTRNITLLPILQRTVTSRKSKEWKKYFKTQLKCKEIIEFLITTIIFVCSRNLSVSNLQYLSSLQAVHDLATFISEMNQVYNFEDVKWISVGGSYAGSLSAWLRLKFPHLVYGAVSSSAPLHAKLEYPGKSTFNP